MGELNIFISNPTKLSIKNENLNLINLDSKEEAFIPIDTISSIVADNPICVFTHTFLDFLSKKNILLITCDNKHLPSGIFLSFLNHSKSSLHVRNQVKLSVKIKSYLWQEIIKTKVYNSSKVLEFLDKENSQALLRLSQKVLLNDSNNCEALAARIYFDSLFGELFKRREDNIINAMLNYGYAIIRAKIARSICSKGLLPSFGIFHSSGLNPFNLADDFLEVFRAFVDIFVYQYLQNLEDKENLMKEDKLYLLGIFQKEIKLNNKYYEFDKVIDELANCYLRIVLAKEENLCLPILESSFIK